VGLVIAIGEVAIGLGVLAGLLLRVAAGAGMVLSFGLFLTVSFHSSPYFTGSDIVFLFAWTPFVLAGAAGAPAIDTWLAERAAVGDAGDPAHGVPRRQVLTRGAFAGIAAFAVLAGGGLVALFGRLAGGASSTDDSTVALGGSGRSPTTTAPSPSTSAPTSSSSTVAVPKGSSSIGAASGVPVGGSAAFTDPATGDPSLVIQQTAGDFVAFDAICPHEGCTVAYQPSAKLIACPCHGSEFNAKTGALIRGPATYGLTSIKITAASNGNLYVHD
jgi:thiosulfate dehydrogenase (quinone) large subunit